jgi:hypothetical protein
MDIVGKRYILLLPTGNQTLSLATILPALPWIPKKQKVKSKHTLVNLNT